MAARGHKIPGARCSEKKNVLFLNFIGPVTPPWVLQPSEIMHMVSAEHLLARVVFAKSIKVLGWQPGAPNTREHDFPKKNRGFVEIQRTIDTSMGSAALEIMHLVSIEPLLASAVLARSIKVLGWQPGAPKFREHDFPKKNPVFF